MAPDPRRNRRGAPTTVLVLQATLGSLLALAMVFVNNINSYCWMLTALVAQTLPQYLFATNSFWAGNFVRISVP